MIVDQKQTQSIPNPRLRQAGSEASVAAHGVKPAATETVACDETDGTAASTSWSRVFPGL
jgi:hypothetical protein